MTIQSSRSMMVRLGFTETAADEIYSGQGIDSIDEWANLDESDVTSLCRTVRKPGGGGDGKMISYKAEMNLQAAVFFIYHKHRTSRTVDYTNITVPEIRALKKQREMEATTESKPEAPTIDLKDVSKTYEALVQYLRGMRGGNGVPLSYTVRPTDKLMPKPSADDPSTEYSTYDEEMVKRAPIIVAGNTNGTESDGPFDDTFVGDWGKVWDLICPFLITTEAWPHVKSARNNHDGMKATHAFYTLTGMSTCTRASLNKQTDSYLRETRQVLEVSSSGHGRNGDDKVEDRNYTKDEDRNLSRDQKWE